VLRAEGGLYFLESVVRQREKKLAALIEERLPTEPSSNMLDTNEFRWPPAPSFPLITIGGGYVLVNDQIFDQSTRSLYYEHGADTAPTRVMLDWLSEEGFSGFAGFRK